jgi:hypothetical protein
LREWYEVEAYAHDIAMEIVRYYPTKNPATVIKQINKHHKLPSYEIYRKAFAGTDWAKLRQSLLRKTWKWSSTIRPLNPVS